jgi:hypothetical protein
MPAEVYLVPEVNAWVGQRGGLMGFGGRRVMGLGLPLLQLLTVSQLKAVLAHEFGHYYGGDTKLGPWIYKTRAAIGRTLYNLSGHSAWLHKPFEWYSLVFLRVTHAISRRQEFVADELAARTVGPKALIDGLRTIHGGALAFDAYWHTEVAPVLNSGSRPPIAEGFSRFINAETVANAIMRSVESELKEGKTDIYDTHPSLPERIAAAEQLRIEEQAADNAPAISLLRDVENMERYLLVAIAGEENVGKLKPVTWEAAGLQVYLPMWEERVRNQASALAGVTAGTLPQVVRNMSAFCEKLNIPAEANVPGSWDRRASVGRQFCRCALVVVWKRGMPNARPSSIYMPTAKSDISCGAAVSKPTTSSMPASSGSAMVKPLLVIPTTIILAGMPSLSRYWRRACAGWGVPAQVSESV